ncbi:MAG: hypothetical protein AMK69_22650 [Nitrospira bacterium SG8_3]|nr:MAG: hypothetical protein AMK69_22650 [Nitrospira bacterium SG8_3]
MTLHCWFEFARHPLGSQYRPTRKKLNSDEETARYGNARLAPEGTHACSEVMGEGKGRKNVVR